VNTSQNDRPKDVWGEVSRFLGGTRNGRFVAAGAIAILFSGLAYIAAHARDLAATVLTAGLLVYGLRLAWRMVPFSSEWHVQRLREQRIAEQCRAAPFRGWLWVGLGTAVATYWRSEATSNDDCFAYAASAFLLLVGVISHLLCRRAIRKQQSG
jgi:hypothetical protein